MKQRQVEKTFDISHITRHVSHIVQRSLQFSLHTLLPLSIMILIGSLLCSGISDAKKYDVKSAVGKATLNGYTQVRFRMTDEKDAVPNNTFLVRRARFQLKAQLTDVLSTGLSMDLTTDDISAKNIYLQYQIDPHLKLRLGQLKKPFSRSYLQSAGKLWMILRPEHIRDFKGYRGRDIGAAVELEPASWLKLMAGVFNGTGIGTDAVEDNNNTKDVAGRVEFSPTGTITVGANTSIRGQTDAIQEDRQAAYGVDVELQFLGFRFAAEGLWGDKRQFDTQQQMFGWYAVIVRKQRIKKCPLTAIEYGGRIESFDGDRDAPEDAVTMVTPYLGIYFHSDARLQLTPIYHLPQRGDRILEFLAQAQMNF